MTLIDATDAEADTASATFAAPPPAEQEPRTPAFYVRRSLGVIAGIGVLYLLVTEGKARSTLVTVAVAVGGSAAIWIGANLLFNQVRDKWQRFTMLLYFSVTLIVTTLISGNRAIGNEAADDPIAKAINKFVNGISSGTLTSDSLVPRFTAMIWIPLVLAVAAGAIGLLLTRTDALATRLAIGAGGLGLVGVAAGAFWNFNARPEVDAVGLVAWTALAAGIGAGIGFLRSSDPMRPMLLGAAIGWVIGAFGAPDIGGGPSGWTIVAVAVPPALIGVRAALNGNLALRERGAIDINSRKWIFLAPAVLFAGGMLVVPAISTIWLSLKNRSGDDFIRNESGDADLFANYRNIFDDPNSWNPPDGLSFQLVGLGQGASWILLAVLTVVAGFVGGFVRRRSAGDDEAPPVFSPGYAVTTFFGILAVGAIVERLLPSSIEQVVGFNLFALPTGTSRLMIIGLIVLAVFVGVGLLQKSRTGKVVELGSPSMGPLIVGGLLVMLAVVTTFRGTIMNNLWWVIVVTLFSTGLGLAIAVLADGVRFEQVAKSIIFMPMAISLVGASVIWRFMYVARDSSTEQTGVLNSLWVALGRVSTGREVASVALVIIGGLLGVALLNKLARKRSNTIGMVGGAGVVVAVTGIVAALIWLFAGTTNTSTTHFVVSIVLVALAVIAAVAIFVLAVMKDAIGMVAGAVYAVVLAAVLYGFASVWGGSLTGFTQKVIVGVAVGAILLALLAMTAQRLTTQNFGGAVLPLILAALIGWFLLRYLAVWGGGVGGQSINTVGNLRDSPINFVQESPWNSMFLMVVLIWIQTGFAMVILSAAIKAVPTELIEAAKVDGATDSQVFWRVTLPQIAPTIGVVVTTIIVLVMKVFDIVNVMTNGNFETQVLANDMFFQAFQSQNQGQGAALAILIFVSVLPIMVFNIRKMQQEN
ncbi:MAG: ABC transporter permease subunit [Ilumatobacter sp.]|uniref:carbohydrate ABC transporter permease n=1 Tax=Ilumatobacter sp. TaxID=1967498 RepID=UPI003297D1D1